MVSGIPEGDRIYLESIGFERSGPGEYYKRDVNRWYNARYWLDGYTWDTSPWTLSVFSANTKKRIRVIRGDSIQKLWTAYLFS